MTGVSSSRSSTFGLGEDLRYGGGNSGGRILAFGHMGPVPDEETLTPFTV